MTFSKFVTKSGTTLPIYS